jgi:hypothetical protein
MPFVVAFFGVRFPFVWRTGVFGGVFQRDHGFNEARLAIDPNSIWIAKYGR